MIKTRAVRKRSFACILRNKGYKLLAVRANRKYPEHDVYIFEATPEFDKDLTELIEEIEEWMKERGDVYDRKY
jgi:hypothetical protein